MSFRILGTNHTSFTVSSLERSIGFLRDCLGFELISSKAPGHTLELIDIAPPRRDAA
jgi:catechol 2,3-dioxygenase-like lactoylglutathione lyase family enzyme